MQTPRDLGWGNPYDLTGADMVRCDIGAFVGQVRQVWLRNADVGVLAAELVRQLVAAGWSGPNPEPDEALDDWGYNGRLKRWAQNAGQQWGTAPMSSVSDHAWGTGLDVNTIANPMLARRPADPWAHCDLPRETAAIAAELGWDPGVAWAEPWDPQHFGLAIGPAEARRRADIIRAARAAGDGDEMNKEQAARALAILEAMARSVPPLYTTVVQIRDRQLAINAQEVARDEADRVRDEALARHLDSSVSALVDLLDDGNGTPAVPTR